MLNNGMVSSSPPTQILSIHTPIDSLGYYSMTVTAIENWSHFQQVTDSFETSVILFYAVWAEPSTYIKPAFEEVARQTMRLRFYTVDMDGCEDFVDNYGSIHTLPTITAFKSGQKVDQLSGSNESALHDMIAKLS
ncbi:thioredoxin-like protein [Clavulina sp. PMI_390]|nr:thioredoxin-like protein [Clavulina sp. PMI_390]